MGSFHCVPLIASFSLKVSGNSLQAFPPLKNGKHKDNLKKNMKKKFEKIFLKKVVRQAFARVKDFPSFTHSIYISRLLRAAPHTEYLMGVTRQGRSNFSFFLTRFFSSFIFYLSPHNHWHGAYFSFQYFVLEMLGIEIESLAVRGCLNILSV